MIISFIATITNIFTGIYNTTSLIKTIQIIFNVFVSSSIGFNGAITILSLITISKIQEDKIYYNPLKILFLIIAVGLFSYMYLDFSSGSFINIALFYIFGFPITLLLLIVPVCIMSILEIFSNRITPPINTIKNKIIASILFIYGILCIILTILQIKFLFN